MPGAKLSLELELADAMFHAGEEVRGHVVVAPKGAFACERLTVDCRWKAHGKGNEEHGPWTTVELGAFEAKEGDAPSRVPFALVLPVGPLTYHGTIVKLDWELHARAHVPWAADPAVSRHFTMRAMPREARELRTSGYRGPVTTGPDRFDLGPGWSAPAAVRHDAASAKQFAKRAFVAWGGAAAISAPLFALGHVFLGVLFGLGSLAALNAALSTLRAQRTLGDREARVTPEVLAAGGRLSVRASLRPSAVPREAWIELRAAEGCIEGSGSHKRHHKHELSSDRRTLDATAVDASGTLVLAADFDIPRSVTPTFIGNENEVRWQVHVHVSATPDWDEVVDVAIVP